MVKTTVEKSVLHFLHIGKTGGTNVKHALADFKETASHVIHLHTHNVKLQDIPRGQKVFLFLRNPIYRFVSSFYSRQRKGMPRYFQPWSPEEESAFTLFRTANELAEALDAPSGQTREAAHLSMSAIRHVRTSFYDWLVSDEYLEERAEDIFFIGFQETLAADFDHLTRKLGLPDGARLSDDDTIAHKNPPGIKKELSSKAVLNLENWYRKDIGLYKKLWMKYKAGSLPVTCQW